MVLVADDPYPLDWELDNDANGASNGDRDVLSIFVTFLRQSSSAQFGEIVGTAALQETSATVWSRIIGIARNRSGVVDDLVWPFASTREMVETAATARDAIAFVSNIYASRSVAERRIFEGMMVEPRQDLNERQSKWWQHMTARVASTVPASAVVTDEFRSLQEELVSAGKTHGNTPFASIRTSWGSANDIGDDLLSREGVDLQEAADHAINEAVKVLERQLRPDPAGEASAATLLELWRAAEATIIVIRHNADKAHSETLHRAWGTVGDALHRLVVSEHFNSATATSPIAETIAKLAIELSRNPHPEPQPDGKDDVDSDFMSWGNWDVRVHASAAIIILVPRVEGATRALLLERAAAMLADPIRTVRLQVAERLNVLWDVEPVSMWSLLDAVAKTEVSQALLSFVVAQPLGRLSRADPEKVEGILTTIMQRFAPSVRPPQGEKANTKIDEALGGLVAYMAVVLGRPIPLRWVADWINDFPHHDPRLWHAISTLRSALFLNYRANPSEQDLQVFSRAKTLLDELVVRAASDLARVKKELIAPVDDEVRRAAEEVYIAADHLLDHCCNQLFFGSGAFASRSTQQDNAVGLAGPDEKKRFLNDYLATLDHLGSVGTPQTIHHLLDLYTHLADGDPARVFDCVAEVILGGGAAEGYHYESLGADALVKLMRRYLADYRSVFDDVSRRERLIAVLDLFARTGWAVALKLLYEIPDHLR